MARRSNSNARGKSGRGNGGQGRSSRRSARPPTNRQFPRTARLNALFQEIVAEYFERVEDEHFDILTITGVEVDADLNKAQVFVSTLDSATETSDQADEALLDALAEHRKPVQAAIASQTRIRKTPEVVFGFDPSVRSGARIEEILSELHGDNAAHGEGEVDDNPEGQLD